MKEWEKDPTHPYVQVQKEKKSEFQIKEREAYDSWPYDKQYNLHLQVEKLVNEIVLLEIETKQDLDGQVYYAKA